MLKILPLAGILCPALLFAEELTDEVRFKYQYYTDNNGVTVSQPTGHFTRRLGKNTAVSGQFLLDAITGASRHVLNPRRPDTLIVPGDSGISADAISGATQRREDYPLPTQDSSRFFTQPRGLSVDAVSSASTRETRRSWGCGLTHQYGTTRAALGFTKSRENDYHSLSGFMSVTKSFFNSNTVISAAYKLFKDRIRPVAESIGYGRGGDKLVDNINLSLTQDLSPATTAMTALNIVISRGYLGRPYYSVLLDNDLGNPSGQFAWESYPDHKNSVTGLFKVRRFFDLFSGGSSLNLEYQHYQDTWGVVAHSAAVSGYQYLHANLYCQVKYRFYMQAGADFYRHRYRLSNINPQSHNFMSYLTADPKLSDFNSHLVQAKLVLLLNRFHTGSPGKIFSLFPTRIDFETQRYFRGTSTDQAVRYRQYTQYGSKGLRAWIFRSGLVFSY